MGIQERPSKPKTLNPKWIEARGSKRRENVWSKTHRKLVQPGPLLPKLMVQRTAFDPIRGEHQLVVSRTQFSESWKREEREGPGQCAPKPLLKR